MISLISALAEDQIIGIKNTIPWRLPADLQWFKKNTMSKPVIMGRRTFESIGHPLIGRLNIVVSHHKLEFFHKEVICVTSLYDAVKAAGNTKEIMVIGGSRIYEQMLMHADRLYLTHINLKVIGGDTRFPIYHSYKWISIFSEFHHADRNNAYSYCFEILDRKR